MDEGTTGYRLIPVSYTHLDVYKRQAVVKAGQTIEGQDYVDGISGGTITSKGVNAMLLNSIGEYKNFLLKLNAAHKNESEEQ